MIKNKKIFRNLSIAICIIWVIAFFANLVSINVKQSNYEKLYAELMSSTTYHNAIENWNNNANNVNNEQPLFNNATDALITAWNNFESATSYELFGNGEAYGTGSVAGVGYGIEFIMQNDIVKWKDGTEYYNLERYQKESIPMFGTPITRSDEYFCPVGERWCRFTLDLSYVNGTIISNYTAELSKHKTATGFSMLNYIINNDTIARINYFNINHNIYTGKLESYSVSVSLNTVSATKNYLANIKKENEQMIVGEPKETKLNFNCIIGKDGNFISLGIDERYVFTGSYSGIQAEVSTDSNVIYNFLSINKEPTMAKYW